MSLSALLLAAAMHVPAHAGQGNVTGYVRAAARPDFQGAGATLGYWNLYGRLMNEGPYAMIELDYDIIEREPMSKEPWTDLHFRVEGGAISRASSEGSLSGFLTSQLYVRGGNVLMSDVTWQVGTLDRFLGDLGLYDMRPAQIFFETVGASALWERPRFEWLVGFGDSGFFLNPQAYSTILTPGTLFRVRLLDQLEIGGGGMYRYEPEGQGNVNAPHQTPGLDYEAWVRGEAVQTWMQQNPNRAIDFPNPESTDAHSGKLVGYLGTGGYGPVIWNNLFVSWERLHPQGTATEWYEDTEYTLYVHDFTDERTVFLMGNELQLRVIPGRFDIAWGGLYGRHKDGDNAIIPTDHARTYMSTVLRGQVYITDTVHWLTETSIAKEVSENGNQYREHYDSLFANTDGRPDARGLENGDTDTRYTWQGKAGLVLNPLGKGVYSRPSLRFLYGAQYSNQNNAFGNSFVETIDQYNDFGNVERHWHHVLSLETEAWF